MQAGHELLAWLIRAARSASRSRRFTLGERAGNWGIGRSWMPNQQGEYHSERICIPCGDDFRRVAPARRGSARVVAATTGRRPHPPAGGALHGAPRPPGMPYSRPALTGTPLMTDPNPVFVPRRSRPPADAAGGMVLRLLRLGAAPAAQDRHPSGFDGGRPRPGAPSGGRWAAIARSTGTGEALRAGAPRIDLQGQPAGVVTRTRTPP
ncbi:MAG: hypothetical protein MZV65_46085 [Chromatiales bacterium]|nr:hypothetical protein [Chromatiales bacterium]